MDEQATLARAVEWLRAQDKRVDEVAAFRVYEDRIAIVANNGIAGGPKYIVPLADLPPLPQPEPEDKPKRKRTKREE